MTLPNEMNMTKTATAIELFSGCGGMSCGLLSSGYNVLLGIDNNAEAIDAYNYNHEHVGSKGWVANVRGLDRQRILSTANLGHRRLNLLTGGPPCQPFSIVGKRRALEDDRGDLVLEYVRLANTLEPEALVFENVANFAKIQGGEIADMVISGMEKAGYAVSHGVLDASDYGVAQMRKRFVIIGIRGKRPLRLPEATHGTLRLLGQRPVRTCRDVLDDLPDVDTEEALLFSNHEGTTHSPAMVKMLNNSDRESAIPNRIMTV